jgi:hypothetical protein
MLPFLLKPLGRVLEKRKWETDRKHKGLWIGPPPVLLNGSDLLAGDVVFCGQGNNRKLGDVIRTATAGEYTHCALYIGKGYLVDVTKDGCQRRTLEEFLKAYSYLAVTRCPGNEENRMRRSALIRFARSACRGAVSGYSIVGAALVTFRELADLTRMRRPSVPVRSTSRKAESSRDLFCSEFVLEAYVAAGYIERDDPYLVADRRTPTGLAEENIFELVGYMSELGLKGVSRRDTFLAGCGWVLSERGQRLLRQQEEESERLLDEMCI